MIADESSICVLGDLWYWGSILSTYHRHSGHCSGVSVSLRSPNGPALFLAMGCHVAKKDYPHINAWIPQPLYVYHLVLHVALLCMSYACISLGSVSTRFNKYYLQYMHIPVALLFLKHV